MKKIFSLYFLFVFLISCDFFNPIDKQAEKFVSQIESKMSNMTERDWEMADKEIEILQQKIEHSRKSMTPSQIEIANKAIGKYYAIRVKSNINDMKNILEDVKGQVKGFIEELVDTTDKN